MSTAAATALAAGSALIGATIAAIAGYVHNSRATFFQALDWLSGGTQRRSLGIATIEVVWRRRRSVSARLFGSYGYFRDLSIPVLESSAVYLLLAKEQPLKAHESRNLSRIMELLVDVKGTERKRHASVYRDLTEVLAKAERRLGAVESEDESRELVARLRRWREALNGSSEA